MSELSEMFAALSAEKNKKSTKGTKHPSIKRLGFVQVEKPATPSQAHSEWLFLNATDWMGWVESQQLVVYERQHCICCGGVQTYVQGAHIEMRHDRMRATATRPGWADPSKNLPTYGRIVETHIPRCFECQFPDAEATALELIAAATGVDLSPAEQFQLFPETVPPQESKPRYANLDSSEVFDPLLAF